MTAPAVPPAPPTAAPSSLNLLGMLGIFSTSWAWISWGIGLIWAKVPTQKTWVIALLAAAATLLFITWDQHAPKLRALLPSGITIQSPITLQTRLPQPPKVAALLAAPVADPVVVAPSIPPDIEPRLSAVESAVSEIQARLGVVRRRAPVAK